jgi:hypothetical protein
MLDGTGLSNSGNFSTVPFTGTVNSRTRWFDSLTARGGYLLTPQVLLYAQGGAAWTNTDSITFNSGGSQVGDLSNNHTGWTLGAGVEWMFHGLQHAKCDHYRLCWHLYRQCEWQCECAGCPSRRELQILTRFPSPGLSSWRHRRSNCKPSRFPVWRFPCASRTQFLGSDK